MGTKRALKLRPEKKAVERAAGGWTLNLVLRIEAAIKVFALLSPRCGDVRPGRLVREQNWRAILNRVTNPARKAR
jgi:hypothetical protein